MMTSDEKSTKSPVRSALPESFCRWFDDETGILIEQFSEAEFETDVLVFDKHALFFSFTGVVDLWLEATGNKHLLPGQGVFHAAQSQHKIKTLKPTSFIRIFFPTKYIDTFTGSENFGSWQSHVIDGDSYLMDVMELLDKEFGEQDHHSEEVFELLSRYIAVHLVRSYSTIKFHNPHTAGRPEICQIMCALEYIECNLAENTPIADVMNQTQLSKHRFLRTFKEITGQSPQQYIIRRRLEIARHLLRRADLSLDEIARRSGFADQSHFSKAYRKQFGQTPALHRRA